MHTYIAFSFSSDSILWSGDSGSVNISAASMPLNVTIASTLNVTIQIKGNGDLTNGLNSIPLSNVYVSQTNSTSGNGLQLTTDYQDWMPSIPPSEGETHASYWFLTIPGGTPSGTYTFTFYIQVIAQT